MAESTSLAELEQRVEDIEIMAAQVDSDDLLINRVEKAVKELKCYCLKPDHADDVLRRPLSQLKEVVNFLKNPRDVESNVAEKVNSINAQTNLLSHRLEQLQDMENLKEELNAEDLAKLVQMEGQILQRTSKLQELCSHLDRTVDVVSKEQARLDRMIDLLEKTVSNLERSEPS